MMATIMDYHDIQAEIKKILKYGDHGDHDGDHDDPPKKVGFEFDKQTWKEIPSGK